MDVSFPGAAFVVVSCKENQLGCRKEYVNLSLNIGYIRGNTNSFTCKICLEKHCICLK